MTAPAVFVAPYAGRLVGVCPRCHARFEVDYVGIYPSPCRTRMIAVFRRPSRRKVITAKRHSICPACGKPIVPSGGDRHRGGGLHSAGLGDGLR
jgi:hypothetical protein